MEISSNIVPNKLTFDEHLILEVQAHPILYNKSLGEYKNRNKVNDAWIEIAAVLKVPMIQAKKRWKNLKDTFRAKFRELTLCPSGSAASKKKQWLYYSKMSFLIPYIQVDETESNYISNEHSEDNSVENDPPGENLLESDDNAEFAVPAAKRRREEQKDRKHVTNKILKALDNLEKDSPPSSSSIKLFFDSLAAKAESLEEYQQSVLEMSCLEAYQRIKFSENF